MRRTEKTNLPNDHSVLIGPLLALLREERSNAASAIGEHPAGDLVHLLLNIRLALLRPPAAHSPRILGPRRQQRRRRRGAGGDPADPHAAATAVGGQTGPHP